VAARARARQPRPGAPPTEARLTPAEARRLAIRAQQLAGPRPGGVLDVVRGSGPLQLDPTNAVARSHLLVLWSRLGSYDVGEVDRLLWEQRALFQWRAFIHPREHWPLVAAAAKRFPGTGFARAHQIRDWLRDNDAFRRYVLAELRRRGPLPQRELEDRSVRPWESRGWTHDKNVSQMLEFLWGQGKVLVAGRQGQERLWDLAERVVARVPSLPPGEAARVEVERCVRSAGFVTRAGFGRMPALWLLPLDAAFDRLVRERVVLPVEVDGLRDTWFVHRDALDDTSPFRGRTTLLSPFDRLVYDRTRAEELFGFHYRLEIYVPKPKREYGYFVLPILHGDRLVGRIDPLFDRRTRLLRVHEVYAEPGAPKSAGPAVAQAIARLAGWLGAGEVAYSRVPPIWASAFRHTSDTKA
jgi:uncharacterized protein